MSSRFVKFLAIISVIGLSACASPPRTAEADSGFKTVGVVSLVDEDTPAHRIGLTVFNNDYRTISMGGELNRIATTTLEDRLRQKRSSWTVKPMDADSKALLAKFKSGGVSWSSQTGNIKAELAELAKVKGVDALFVVIDTSLENSRGRGVGMVIQAPPLVTPRVTVHSRILVVLVDKNGAEITNRVGNQEINAPASEFGLTGDASSIDSPGVQDKLKTTYREFLSKGVGAAAGYMGY